MKNEPTTEAATVSKAGSKFRTMSIYLSGAICGSMWWPQSLGGKPFRKDARGPWGFWQKGDSFRDALNGVLMREGGDFQNPLFTADTIVRIERRSIEGAGKYTVHVWERTIADLADCADLVNQDAYTGDFFNDGE